MTLAEFKAWFEGFSEIMDGPPDAKQWDRIKARVSEIDSKPISYPVYIDRYVTPYRRWYDTPIMWGHAQDSSRTSDKITAGSFDVLNELKSAGRAEYRASLAS